MSTTCLCIVRFHPEKASATLWTFPAYPDPLPREQEMCCFRGAEAAVIPLSRKGMLLGAWVSSGWGDFGVRSRVSFRRAVDLTFRRGFRVGGSSGAVRPG